VSLDKGEVQHKLGKGTLGSRDLLKIENIEEEFPHKEVKKIVKELQEEGLIQIKK
jgi:hypothetical protein